MNKNKEIEIENAPLFDVNKLKPGMHFYTLSKDGNGFLILHSDLLALKISKDKKTVLAQNNAEYKVEDILFNFNIFNKKINEYAERWYKHKFIIFDDSIRPVSLKADKYEDAYNFRFGSLNYSIKEDLINKNGTLQNSNIIFCGDAKELSSLFIEKNNVLFDTEKSSKELSLNLIDFFIKKGKLDDLAKYIETNNQNHILDDSLFIAVNYKSIGALNLLVQAGADLTWTKEENGSPCNLLHEAVKTDSLKTVDYIISSLEEKDNSKLEYMLSQKNSAGLSPIEMSLGYFYSPMDMKDVVITDIFSRLSKLSNQLNGRKFIVTDSLNIKGTINIPTEIMYSDVPVEEHYKTAFLNILGNDCITSSEYKNDFFGNDTFNINLSISLPSDYSYPPEKADAWVYTLNALLKYKFDFEPDITRNEMYFENEKALSQYFKDKNLVHSITSKDFEHLCKFSEKFENSSILFTDDYSKATYAAYKEIINNQLSEPLNLLCSEKEISLNYLDDNFSLETIDNYYNNSALGLEMQKDSSFRLEVLNSIYEICYTKQVDNLLKNIGSYCISDSIEPKIDSAEKSVTFTLYSEKLADLTGCETFALEDKINEDGSHKYKLTITNSDSIFNIDLSEFPLKSIVDEYENSYVVNNAHKESMTDYLSSFFDKTKEKNNPAEDIINTYGQYSENTFFGKKMLDEMKENLPYCNNNPFIALKLTSDIWIKEGRNEDRIKAMDYFKEMGCNSKKAFDSFFENNFNIKLNSSTSYQKSKSLKDKDDDKGHGL